MTFDWDGQKGEIPVKFIHSIEDVSTDDSGAESSEERSSDEEEYEEQELNGKTYLMWMANQDDWTTTRPKRKN
ncbi:4062_t:CDS:2 [Ambispora gerdemannii]|uniref:4062_t:CDS:1 n=1 Tax=Ambispora gerdemannii TaxID=144530 RepID=A0A9N9BTF0_9GLOM|nr:4062_t:CDS:2 [Ambispora gerdemannii]